MKKYILGIIVIIATFFTITNVYAENEYPDSGWEIPTIKGEVVIKWRDYGNGNNNRPDKITIKLLNHDTSETKTKVISKDDVEIVEIDNVTTEWRYDISILKTSTEDGYTLSGVEGIKNPYRVRTYDGTLGKVNDKIGDKIEIVIDSALDKYITYTEHWNDDNRRDSARICGLEMNPLNNSLEERRVLTCSEKSDTYIDENTCQLEVHIPYPYPIINEEPAWNTPTQFSYKVFDKLDNYDYDIKVDEEGNIDVYINHEPYKMENSKVKVIWKDEENQYKKRPTSITLDIYNYDTKENSITVTNQNDWESAITNLYQNYKEGKESNYSLKIKNTKDYEFNVTGDIKNGYTITAKYIGNEQTEINNPDTSDNILYYILLTITSTLGLIYTGYKLKTKN